MRILQHPDVGMDMQIINNARLRYLQKAGLVSRKQKTLSIPRFRCPERLYLCCDMKLVMMCMSDTLDIEQAIEAVRKPIPPVELWILQDDKVTMFRDLSEK